MLNRVLASTAAIALVGGLLSAAVLLRTDTPGAPSATNDATASFAAASAFQPAPIQAAPLQAPSATGSGLHADATDAPTIAAIIAAEPVTEAAADPLQRRTVSLGRGDTLMELLLEEDVRAEEAQEIVGALKPVFDPRRIRAGQEFTLVFETDGEGERFVGMEFQPSVERSVTIAREDAGFSAKAVDTPLERRLTVAEGSIDFSFDQAASAAGVPAQVRSVLINQLYSYEVDWQRDIQRGDRFEILYETLTTKDGQVARAGGIVFAALTLSGKRLPVYRFEDDEGFVDYFNAKGESIRKALLRTPIDGAKLTSGFGMRMHPLLGYSKMHKGVDFGAPVGTPVYAAGHGVIDEVGPKGAYGNYVRIRHNNQIETAYAHLSRFGRNIRRGARVAQGDIIGYVGSTGRSTGPHLHYEVMRNDVQVNPLSVDLPAGRTLDGKELKRFHTLVAGIDAQYRQAKESIGEGIALVSDRQAAVATRGKGCTKSPGC